VDVYKHYRKVTDKISILFIDAKHFSTIHIKEFVREGLAQGGSTSENRGMVICHVFSYGEIEVMWVQHMFQHS
jgi:hypothetical protein